MRFIIFSIQQWNIELQPRKASGRQYKLQSKYNHLL